MSKKIMGVTVGTSLSPSKIEEKIKPVKTVNNVAPDENGNVEIEIPQGANGKTPYIKDGYWYIDGVNTNVKAEGKDGKDAYQYAQDGGYGGTEAEFARLLTGADKADKLEVASYFTPEKYYDAEDADDTASIQRAIDNAGSTGIVYLGKKTYKTSQSIEITHSNRTFICEGTISYSGADSAVIIGSKFIEVDIHCIDAPDGTAIKIAGADKYIEYNNININKITSSKIGLHIYTITKAITYNQIKIGYISATETGVFVECLASFVNENYYYLGRITGCKTAIRLHSASTLESTTGLGTNDNYFYSGSFEGISNCAISLENSTGNKFNNLRCQEHYGEKILVMTGFCKNNDIKLSRIYTKEIDITGLTGGSHNILQSSSIHDILDGYNLGTKARIDHRLGITYDPRNANIEVNVGATTFPDNIIKQVNTLIPTVLYFNAEALNGMTYTIDGIYSDFMSMARGFPLCLVFGETDGKILLKDNIGDTVIDNTNGEYAGKTISVRWNGYDKLGAKNIWDIQIVGESFTDGKTPYIQDGYWYIDGVNTNVKAQGVDGKDGTNGKDGKDGADGAKGDKGDKGDSGANGTDGKTPVKGTDYFTPSEIADITTNAKNAVLANLPNEVWTFTLEDGTTVTKKVVLG